MDKHRIAPLAARVFVRLLAAFAIMSLLAPVAVYAQSPRDVRLLTTREAQRLTPEARQSYEAATQALDKINPVAAIKQFDQAAQASPDSLELQFLTARIAHLRARRLLDAEAEKYYDIATGALERVAEKENLTPLEMRRYEVQMKEITEERQKLELRKQKRLAVGIEFRKIYAKERYIDPEKRERAREQERRRQRAARRADQQPTLGTITPIPPAPMPGGGGLPMQPPGGGYAAPDYDS